MVAKVMTPEQYEGLVRPASALSADELLEFQVAKLVECQLCVRANADPFRSRLPQDGRLFLFVPPAPNVLPLAELMVRVELDGKTGVNYLDVAYLTDVPEVPRGAHLLTAVEDGWDRRNVKPNVSRANIAREGRVAYTTFRGIIHAILFPWMLRRNYMDLVGSRCYSDYVPFLYLVDDKPTLGNYGDDDASPSWGAPSAGSVIGA